MPEEESENSILLIDTILRYHLSVPNPDDLSDEEWAGSYACLIEIIKAENSQD